MQAFQIKLQHRLRSFWRRPALLGEESRYHFDRRRLSSQSNMLLIRTAIATVLLFIILSRWTWRRDGRAALLRKSVCESKEALSFDWREVLPELGPVHLQLKSCAAGLQESLQISDMSKFYTCPISEASKMRSGGQCVEEGLRHIGAILNSTSPPNSLLSTYQSYEQEDRGHGAGLRIQCGQRIEAVDDLLRSALGANVTIRLDDRRLSVFIFIVLCHVTLH